MTFNPSGFSDTAKKAINFVVNPLVMDKIFRTEKMLGIAHPVGVNFTAKQFKSMLKDEKNILPLLTGALGESAIARKGKILFRDADNALIRDRKAVTKLSKFIIRAGAQEQKDFVVSLNEKFHGKKLINTAGKIIDDVEIVPFRWADFEHYQQELEHIRASALKVGADPNVNISLLRDAGTKSWFSKPSTAYKASTKTIGFEPLLAGDAVHEFTHARDFKNPLFNIASTGLTQTGNLALLGFPLAYVAGEEIKEAIPGKADDYFIDFMKNWGPEVYLGSRYLKSFGLDEIRAYKNTVKHIKQDPQFFQNMSQGASINDLINAQRWKLGTYAAYPGLVYGAMRGGTALHEKESSIKPLIGAAIGALGGAGLAYKNDVEYPGIIGAGLLGGVLGAGAGYGLSKLPPVYTEIATGPVQTIIGSVDRGVQSVPHLGSIIKSMIMSSPHSPRQNLLELGGISLATLGLLYGLNDVITPDKPVRDAVKTIVEEKIL